MGAARNQDTLETLVTSLQENGGDRHLACRRARCSVAWLTSWCRDDPKVEDAIKQAIDAGTAVLESALLKRAIKGVKKDVYFKGEVVGQERIYSDSNLQFALKARKPEEYGNKLDINKTITIKTLTDDELDQRITDLSARLGITYQPLEDADFTEVVEDAEYVVIELDDLL